MEEQSRRQRIVCIVGPTACHKTELSIELAKRISGEIVSADSVQVYFGMDIGSAKPTVEERQGIPHHLIDCLPINTPEFSASLFRQLAASAINDILLRGKIPIVVGGSGLYVNALTYPLGFAVPKDDTARENAICEYDHNAKMAYARLKSVDPITAARLHPNDKKRIVRALEVFDCSGQPLSGYGADFQNSEGREAPFEPIIIGLTMDREQLYARINLRVDLMMEHGLLAEARAIYDVNYDRTLPAMKSIGYQQLFAYFEGNCTLEEAVEKIKQDTRHFAKRQLTWFKRDERIVWHDVTSWDDQKNDLIEQLARDAQVWMKGKTP
ncbi:MAG TPA: tRNA (adenosine(37)-N6)-dimethylallyltransferase MiaA [Clostridia bacterium]|nr:tRNA (adenosine(37)-N6)-dimethylallyltransferase MiaA [Clostridia bacterium]